MFLVYRIFFVYVPDVYVCRHMACDLESSLEDSGLDVKIVRGVTNFGCEGHVWCAVNISGFLFHVDSIGWYPLVPSLLYHNLSYFESYDDYLNS